MPTLHIEHPITDLRTWRAAFDRFASVRQRFGVRAQRVSQPIDDPQFVVIDLDFDGAEDARGFLDFLQRNVWASRESSPALAGAPEAKILQVVHDGEHGA